VIANFATRKNVTVKSYWGNLLRSPESLKNLSGEPYRVYTPFMKKLDPLVSDFPVYPHAKISPFKESIQGQSLEDLGLLPSNPWHTKLHQYWKPGESQALRLWQRLLNSKFDDYKQDRDYPSIHATSSLSARLRTGELSPRYLLRDLQALLNSTASKNVRRDVHAFAKQIVWREFSYHTLYHFPHMIDAPLNPRFYRFRYETRYQKLLELWQQGRTGIPIVDAGMRELWESGTMHNRVRMIVASFLTKNCLVSWEHGASWFWDTLVDADLALNSFNWQWVAGCGADAAPYFRIFNPVLQSKKFDPDATYIKTWLPELRHLGANEIHSLGESGKDSFNFFDYPTPIVDLKTSREAALKRYKQLGQSSLPV
jgi:deoxyribodipyrimidine photo-lyase